MKLKIAKTLYKLKKLFRNRGQLESRKNFLRLEKNEKTTPFKRKTPFGNYSEKVLIIKKLNYYFLIY